MAALLLLEIPKALAGYLRSVKNLCTPQFGGEYVILLGYKKVVYSSQKCLFMGYKTRGFGS